MKRLIFLLACLALLCGFGALVLRGFSLRHSEKEATAEPTADDAKEAPTTAVHLDREQQELLKLEYAPAKAGTLPPLRKAYGRVIDPLPFVTLDGELAAAEAALEVSRSENERSSTLFKNGENVARKSMEAAAAQFRADTITLQSLRQRLSFEWGPELAALGNDERRNLVSALVEGRTAFIRADLAAGDNLAADPISARIEVLGLEGRPFNTKHIRPATSVDPKTLAEAFLLRVESPPFPLRPGMALEAVFSLPGEESTGFIVPRGAVVRHEGKGWVFVRSEDEEFTRHEIPLDAPLADGWFVRDGIEPKDSLVVSGAQALLSKEILPSSAPD